MVVANPADIDRRCLWAASLRGTYVVAASVVLHGKGAAIKYKPALSVKRKVWISGGFEQKRPVVAKVIRDTVASARDDGEVVGWKLIASEARSHTLPVAAQAGHSRCVVGCHGPLSHVCA